MNCDQFHLPHPVLMIQQKERDWAEMASMRGKTPLKVDSVHLEVSSLIQVTSSVSADCKIPKLPKHYRMTKISATD